MSPAAVDFLPGFQALHRELASSSSRGQFRLIPEANHLSLLTDESQARQTSAAILDVGREVRATRMSGAVSP